MSTSANVESFQEILSSGAHCSQCVFSYWADRMGIDHDFAMRLSSGLGLGDNHGDSCGAVTATALALGLVYGFSDSPESGTRGVVEKLVREFNEAFIERNGSVLCRDLLSGGYDGADPNAVAPEGVNPWEYCAKYCADAVELAEKYLTDEAIADAQPLLLSSVVPASDVPATDVPAADGQTNDAPSPYAVAAGSGAAGVALGALATLVITYEKRRAENEREAEKRP